MIEAGHFLSVAESCARGDEAHCRTAVSRAYYAAYHDSRAWCSTNLREMGSATATHGMHAIFQSELAHPSKANSAEFQRQSLRRGLLLRNLYALRIRADYLLTEDVSREDALQAIADAALIVGIGAPLQPAILRPGFT